MWKYLRYTSIIILKLVGKIIGVPIFYRVDIKNNFNIQGL